MIAAALLCLASLQGQRLVPAELVLSGPLDGLVLDCGGRGRVELTLPLLVGERRTLRVPLPGRPLDGAPPRIEVTSGEVEFVGYLDAPGSGSAGQGAISPALERRTRPPVGRPVPAADPVALLFLAAGCLATLAARRRPRVAVPIGLGVAGLVLAAQLRHAPPSPGRVRVLEGEAAVGRVEAGAWVLVEGSAGVLPIDPSGDLTLEVEPQGAPLTYVGDGQGRWSVLGPELWRRAPLEPGGRRLDGRMNLWGNLAGTWLRTPEGDWTDRGAWPIGVALPGSGVVGQPPGWLAAGLPQGRGVLVARLEPDTWAGPEGPGGVPELVWLRVVGFDFAGAR